MQHTQEVQLRSLAQPDTTVALLLHAHKTIYKYYIMSLLQQHCLCNRCQALSFVNRVWLIAIVLLADVQQAAMQCVQHRKHRAV
jgi:hypothetical protein